MKVEHELEETKSLLLSLQKELQDVSLELAKKLSEVQNLHGVIEKMKLELQKNRMGFNDHLMHQTATSSSELEVSTDIELYISRLCIMTVQYCNCTTAAETGSGAMEIQDFAEVL